MPTNFLNLSDLDNLVRGFEQRYAATSVEMLQKSSVRERVPEHDLLRWEAYVHHRVSLRQLSDNTHSKYLSQLEAGLDSEKHQVARDQLDYAA